MNPNEVPLVICTQMFAFHRYRIQQLFVRTTPTLQKRVSGRKDKTTTTVVHKKQAKHRRLSSPPIFRQLPSFVASSPRRSMVILLLKLSTQRQPLTLRPWRARTLVLFAHHILQSCELPSHTHTNNNNNTVAFIPKIPLLSVLWLEWYPLLTHVRRRGINSSLTLTFLLSLAHKLYDVQRY